jgi:hypothetical protein
MVFRTKNWSLLQDGPSQSAKKALSMFFLFFLLQKVSQISASVADPVGFGTGSGSDLAAQTRPDPT